MHLFFFENLIPLTILKISINNNKSIDINNKNNYQKEKFINKIKALEVDYDKKIRELFENFEKMIDDSISHLNGYIENDKEFNNEIKKVDFHIKKCTEDIYQDINRLLKELMNKIEEIKTEFLKDIKCDNVLAKFTSILEMSTGNFGIALSTGAFIGGGTVLGFGIATTVYSAAAIKLGLATSVSLAVPILGIVVGALSVIGGVGYLIYRLFKKNSTKNKERITNFENETKNEIRKSEKKILGVIEEVINKALKKIEDWCNTLEENVDEFRKNKDLFEKYYIEYENIIQQGFGLS